MVIFHSYVSLPEGMSMVELCWTKAASFVLGLSASNGRMRRARCAVPGGRVFRGEQLGYETPKAGIFDVNAQLYLIS